MLAASAPMPPPPLRLRDVVGYEGRCNDVVYCHPAIASNEMPAAALVYFGGDMQDFTENMQAHRESKNYLRWNLEDTARLLQRRFPQSHVIVIRPAKMEYKTFSCFKNFVPCKNCGVPEHTPMHFALQHLEQLLINISEKLRSMTQAELTAAMEISRASHVQLETEEDDSTMETMVWRENLHDLYLDRLLLMLVGFSKGCVVLNQFLYEFHHLRTVTPDDRSSLDVVRRIRDMYWLDGGHSGGKNTWITSRPLLETLVKLGINVHIHVTPYQIRDDRRPWIRKEEKLFGDVLRQLGASLQRTVHFENTSPNLYMHFDLLNVFRLDANCASKKEAQ